MPAGQPLDGMRHLVRVGQLVLRQHRLVEFERGHDRPPVRAAPAAHAVLALQRLPARIGGRWQQLPQGGIVGVHARVVRRRQQQQLAVGAGVHPEPGRRHFEQLLRLRQYPLHLRRAPLHALGQRRQRTQHPQHVPAPAHLPQARAGLHAGDGDRGQRDGGRGRVRRRGGGPRAQRAAQGAKQQRQPGCPDHARHLLSGTSSISDGSRVASGGPQGISPGRPLRHATYPSSGWAGTAQANWTRTAAA